MIGQSVINASADGRGRPSALRAEAFHSAFDVREEDPKRVVIDVTRSHFWDITGINALDRVVLKLRHHDIPMDIVGLNVASAILVEKLGTHDKEGAKLASGH